jgi:hypothetical protein
LSTEDRMSKLIEQVLKATHRGDVAWRVGRAPVSLTRATDNFVPVYLEATYKGKVIVVYEQREKCWTDEESFNWTSSLHFGIEVGDIVMSDYSQYSPMLRQLFEAAKNKASGLDSLLSDLLD